MSKVGRVEALDPIEAGFRLSLETAMAGELRDGDSIAVNGVCLTVVDRGDRRFVTEIGPETARVTTLGALRPGALVNLERPMRPDGRMGGHFVLGHVDCKGVLSAIRVDGEFWWITIGFAPDVAPYFIPKGSVAVDGISLTVATLREAEFINTIISFILIAFAVFLLVRTINKMRRQEEAPPAAPPTKDCIYCFSNVPIQATRCPNCTSELKAG